MGKRGPKPQLPTPEQIEKIERLAGLGFRLDDIAIACDVSSSKLDRWLQREDVKFAYRKGKVQAVADIAERLYEKAKGGDMTAMIFYLKCQANWSDKPVDTPEQQPEIHLYLPEQK